MASKKHPLDHESRNRQAKAEEAAARRAEAAERGIRDVRLQAIAEEDARAEQARVKRVAEDATSGRPFILAGFNDSPKPKPKGLHDWRSDPYGDRFEPYDPMKTGCALCGLTRLQANRINLPCKGRPS